MCSMRSMLSMLSMLLISNFLIPVVFTDDNELRLREELFSNYNKNNRPVLDFHDNVKLYYGIEIKNLEVFDMKAENIKFNLWMTQKWNDQYLSWNKTEYNFDNWEEVESMINEQSPGVWLHPNENKIRMAFSTDNVRKTCRYIFNSNECITNDKRCEWDGEICKNKNVKEIDEDLGKYNTGDKNMDYLDIENIPLKKMTHITLTLDNKILNVYYNGILKKIHTFDNEILFNNGDMFFNMPLTFEGSIFNFKYIPNEINRKKAVEIYKDIPFTSNFTKKFRFNNYLRRLKLKDAIKTIFI